VHLLWRSEVYTVPAIGFLHNLTRTEGRGNQLQVGITCVVETNKKQPYYPNALISCIQPFQHDIRNIQFLINHQHVGAGAVAEHEVVAFFATQVR
jgi:hypothetical protein